MARFAKTGRVVARKFRHEIDDSLLAAIRCGSMRCPEKAARPWTLESANIPALTRISLAPLSAFGQGCAWTEAFLRRSSRHYRIECVCPLTASITRLRLCRIVRNHMRSMHLGDFLFPKNP